VVHVGRSREITGVVSTEVEEREPSRLIQPEVPSSGPSAATLRIAPPASDSLVLDRRAIAQFASARGYLGEECPGFEMWLKRKHDVPIEDSIEAKDALTTLFTSERAAIAAALAGEIAKPEKKRLEHYDEIFEVGLALLANVDPQNEVALSTAVRTAKDVLYAAVGKEVRDLAPDRFNPIAALGVARRFVAQWSYRLQMGDPDRRVGDGAENEARNLVSALDPKRLATEAELAEMTPKQIAALDIAPTHPMWRTEAERVAHPNAYREIEAWLDRAVTAKLKKAGLEVDYRFQDASKVVFLDEIKTTATSPKVTVEDAFGQKLGLKWGEECAVEPVVNRLMMKLGQRFCDVTENRIGAASPKLVLPQGETVESFVRALKESDYEFNAKPHLQTAVVLTRENIDEVLRDLPAGSQVQKQDLIGRTVLTFKESMVDAKHSLFGRSGPVPLHDSAALEDRVRRGMQLAYMWLHLTDNKEDNHRYAFPKKFEEGQPAVAFMHDTGSALGGRGRTGILNEFFVDERFLKKSLIGGDLVSSEFQLYRSTAWDRETMADLMWMAKKICSLSKADIAECAEASHWPDFMRDVLVWKLAARRDLIAKHFGLTARDPAGPAPTIEVPLSTPADREAAARRYGLSAQVIESAMRDAGLLGRPFRDVLVRDGEISRGGNTVLIGLLRDAYYPAGLDQRTNRREDGREYRSLRYGDE
jgi:hypothetical protein